MSLLALIAAHAADVDPEPPVDTTPYAMPTSAPWTVPTYAITPTYDGSGQGMHPDVIDFGPTGWRGWRYWMAMTPYTNTQSGRENPSIIVSQDGYTWTVPAGLTNPIYDQPSQVGGPRWNSDTDLVYDPDTGGLVMFYRERLADLTFQTLYARSSDGVTWPPVAAAINWTRPGPNGTGEVCSPAVIRRGPGDWWLFGVYYDEVTNARTVVAYTATSPEGSWAGPVDVTAGFPATHKPWHIDVIYHDGAFRALVDLGPRWISSTPDGLLTGTSTNGTTWSWSSAPVLTKPATGWDSGELYRATLQPHEDGVYYRVWYSAATLPSSAAQWWTGFTQIPVAEWPSPPA